MFYERLVSYRRTAPLTALTIIDACSLENLSYPLPEKLKTPQARAAKRPVRLGDVLFPLAGNGIDVAIMEMASIEAARIVHNGAKASSFFDQSHTRNYEKLTESFIGHLYRFQGPTCIIPPQRDDHSRPAELSRQFYNTLNEVTHDRAQRRHTIIELQRQIGSRNNYGERAAMQFVATQPQTVPVFFISEDYDARERMRGFSAAGCRVQSFGIISMVEGLKFKPEYLTQTGIRSDVSAQRFFEEFSNCYRDCLSRHWEPHEYGGFGKKIAALPTPDMRHFYGAQVKMPRTVELEQPFRPQDMAVTQGRALHRAR